MIRSAATAVALGVVVLAAQPAADPALLQTIMGIKAIDNHAHVVRPVAGDTGYDALPLDPLEPSTPPLPLRDDNPMFARAWRALFAYPFEDAAPAHLEKLAQLKRDALAAKRDAYPAWVLDQMGTDVVLANRISMGPELQGRRFMWVPYADALMFPLDNSLQKHANADYAALYPMEEALLARYLREAGVAGLPASLDDYCRSVVTATLERQRAGGAVAEKLEAAYLRWLDFAPADPQEAARVYAHYVKGGVPSPAEYKTLQDYLFAYIARESGRLGMAIHIHVANGGGGHYDQRGSEPLLLTWAFNDASLRNTSFVVIHGGYPRTFDTLSLTSKPNVYADMSMWAFMEGPRAQAARIRPWLSTWPEKLLYGTDASPSDASVGWEETGWVASQLARQALAIALTDMMADGEIDRPRAEALARMVLHDNAARLYHLAAR